MDSKLRSDIEALKNLDKKLRFSEQLDSMLETFFEQSPQPAWIEKVEDNGELILFKTNLAFTEAFADAFICQDNDHKCVETKHPVAVDDVIVNSVSGEEHRCKGWKWPIKNETDDVIAVLSMVSEMATN